MDERTIPFLRAVAAELAEQRTRLQDGADVLRAAEDNARVLEASVLSELARNGTAPTSPGIAQPEPAFVSGGTRCWRLSERVNLWHRTDWPLGPGGLWELDEGCARQTKITSTQAAALLLRLAALRSATAALLPADPPNTNTGRGDAPEGRR